MIIRFTLNGRGIGVDAAPDRRVIDLLREDLGLTGAKEGCGSGECGTCTILVNGENRLSCLMLVAQLEGRTITTIEGLSDRGHLHPLQEAFVRDGAVQCGFCSPGMILAASTLLAEKPAPTRAEIREGLSGNLCRCTGYQKIVDAVETAAKIMNQGMDLSERSVTMPSVKAEETGDDRQGGPSLCAGPGLTDRYRGASPAKKVYLPQDLSELWPLMEQEPEAPVFAGGTDLLVRLRNRREPLSAVICLERIPELQGIRAEPAGLWIGAGTTHNRLLNAPLIRKDLPVLAKALKMLGSPPIRNMGTIGGNICTASPAGDTLPPLYVLDAEVELSSPNGRRVVPIGSFITGPGKTGLEKWEILTGIRIQKQPGYNLHHFEKIGQRKALACAVASLAALFRISPTGTVEAVRLAWGSVGPTVITSAAVEAAIIGERFSPATLEKAAALARQAVSPIDDLRATAEYRRTVSGNLLFRLEARHPSGNPE